MAAWILKAVLVFFLAGLLSGCSPECCGSCDSDCSDYLDAGNTTSGVYHITPIGTRTGFDAYCDMTTDGGGWLVFQRRVDGSVDFYKTLVEYEFGFGEDKTSEYWLGLVPLKRILSQGHYEIRFDLEDFFGRKSYATYKLFNIGDTRDNYTLTIRGYTGSAGDSMATHDGHMFSTKDRDNDITDNAVCAEDFFGAWWYSDCHLANLNGPYLSKHTIGPVSISWYKWKGKYISLKKTEMKIRRA